MAIINPDTLGGRAFRSPRPLWVPLAATVLVGLAMPNLAASIVLALGYSTWQGHVQTATLAVGVLDAVIAVACVVGAVKLWTGSGRWRWIVVTLCAADLVVGLVAGTVAWMPSRGTEVVQADAAVILLLMLPPSSRAFFRRD